MAIRRRTLWNGRMIARPRPRRHPTKFHLSPRRRDRIGQDFCTPSLASSAGLELGRQRLTYFCGSPRVKLAIASAIQESGNQRIPECMITGLIVH